jgi:lincosamide nucleotidyltransferase A/C/D/E
LRARGYREERVEDSKPWNFVLGNDSGHEIDVHAIVFDADSNGLYEPSENGVRYPAASLTGVGKIGGCAVRGISPEWMIKFHSGYELKEKDFGDVWALCEKFTIELPDEYARFRKPE